MKLLAQSLLLLLLYSQPNFALALPQCGAPTAACIDSTPCKTISGVTACLSTATLPLGATRLSMDCWDTQKDYSCDLLQIDNCSTLAADGCTQSNSVCSQTDTNGNCTLYDNTYTCISPPVLSDSTTCTGIPTACILKSSSCMTTTAPGTEMAGQIPMSARCPAQPVPPQQIAPGRHIARVPSAQMREISQTPILVRWPRQWSLHGKLPLITTHPR